MIGMMGLCAALAVFVILSFKRCNLALSAIAAGLVLMISNGMDILSGLTDTFSSGFGSFASGWWLMFALGAVFGAVMKESGLSRDIAEILSAKLHGNAVFIILLISLIMSYGGIGTFIIAFTVYPIAVEMFRRERIRETLLPAVMLFCPTTLGMTMLPGTPSVQNMIPAKYLGTDIYAAPGLGIAASVITFALGSIYLANRVKKNKISGEAEDRSIRESQYTASRWLSILPCVILWAVTFVLIRAGLDSQIAVEISMCIAIVVCIIVGKRDYNVMDVVNQGFANGLETVAMTSCVMGFGALVKASPSFSNLADSIMGGAGNTIAADIIVINLIAAITGSSTSGLQLFFETFFERLSQTYLSNQQYHRIIAIASGGLDSMPYATGVVVANKLAKTDLKQTYVHIFITCAVIPLISLVMILSGEYLLRIVMG